MSAALQLPSPVQISMRPSIGSIEEIVTNIVDSLDDIDPAGDYASLLLDEDKYHNRQTLASCSYVNHTWRIAANKLLYHTVFASYHEEYCKEIAATLETYPHLLEHVRVLQLSSDWLTYWWPLGWSAFSSIPRLFELDLDFQVWDIDRQQRGTALWQAIKSSSGGLLGVTKLVVRKYTIPNLSSLRACMDVFYCLEHLEFDDCHILSHAAIPSDITTTGVLPHDQTHSNDRSRALRSFTWNLYNEPPVGGEYLSPIHVTSWLNVSLLEELRLECSAADWTSVFSLCSHIKSTLRILEINYYFEWNSSGTVSGRAPPNLLAFVNELPTTTSLLKLSGALCDVLAWMQFISVAVDLSTLGLHNARLSLDTYTEPPVDLQPLMDTLRVLRQHIHVDFMFTINESSKELLCEASPMFSDALEEGKVGLTLTYLS